MPGWRTRPAAAYGAGWDGSSARELTACAARRSVAAMANAPLRRRTAPFRPAFTLLLFWFALFFFAFALLALLPDLVAAFRTLPPGEGPLTPEELARARDVASRGIAGRLGWVFGLAALATGSLAWSGWLPGVRRT